jgi:hypothetical protein
VGERRRAGPAAQVVRPRGPGSAGGGGRRDRHRGGPDRSRALGDAGPAGAGRRRRAAGRGGGLDGPGRARRDRRGGKPAGPAGRGVPVRGPASGPGGTGSGLAGPGFGAARPGGAASGWALLRRRGAAGSARGRGRRGSFGARADVRARPSGRPAGWYRAGLMGGGDQRARGAAERGVQALRGTQRACPGQRLASVLRDRADRLRGRAADVRLGLAGELAGCPIWRHMRFVPGADGGPQCRGAGRHLRRYRPPRLQLRAVTSRGRRSAGRRGGSPG